MGRTAVTFLAATCFLAACHPTPSDPEPPPQPAKAASRTKSPPAQLAPVPASPTAPPPADIAPRLAQIESEVQADRLDEAAATLATLDVDSEFLATADQQRIAGLRSQVNAKLAERAAVLRADQVSLARSQAQAGALDEALQTIQDVLQSQPTAEERTLVTVLQEEIQEQQRRQRELSTALQLLASDNPSDLRGARRRLLADPDAAFPLLTQAVSGPDRRQAANALGLLHRFKAAERALPLLLSILSESGQADLWPAASRELLRLSAPGAGPRLLEIAAATDNATQRAIVTAALGELVDPPVETITTLLPRVYQDSPELPGVLRAIQHAALVNGQTDLYSLRGFPNALLSADALRRLEELPARLEALALTAPGSETARAARSLAIVTRLMKPDPLRDVKLVRASAELADSAARNALDGVWNSVDVQTMWRHPSDKPAVLVVDLGAERTVAGVRIWNHNEAGGRHRGWKEVDVFVGPANATEPAAEGLVPQAPGLTDPPDYGTVIPVPCVRGRFVRLETRSYWQADGVAGITELQVLGF